MAVPAAAFGICEVIRHDPGVSLAEAVCSEPRQRLVVSHSISLTREGDIQPPHEMLTIRLRNTHRSAQDCESEATPRRI